MSCLQRRSVTTRSDARSALGRRSGLVGAAILFASLCGIGSAATVPVPVDIRIPVVLAAAVNSSTAHVGDAFAFRTEKAETLGSLVVPAGTVGHGRLALVAPAHDGTNGSLALQADTLDLADGTAIAVDIDASKPPRGRLSERTTRWRWIPILVGVVPIVRTRVRGDLILDPGTAFTVVTRPPRAGLAPLATVPTPSASASPSRSAAAGT